MLVRQTMWAVRLRGTDSVGVEILASDSSHWVEIVFEKRARFNNRCYEIVKLLNVVLL